MQRSTMYKQYSKMRLATLYADTASHGRLVMYILGLVFGIFAVIIAVAFSILSLFMRLCDALVALCM